MKTNLGFLILYVGLTVFSIGFNVLHHDYSVRKLITESFFNGCEIFGLLFFIYLILAIISDAVKLL